MIKVAIIEDEKPACEYLLGLLQSVAPDVEVVRTLDNAAGAVAWLSENTVDLLFVDIHLGDDISFSIFEKLKITTPVIFITAYNQYAIKAFRLNSIDYLLKPFSKEDIKQAMAKFRMYHGNKIIDYKKLIELMNSKPIRQERFMVVSGQRIKSIPVGEIAYFISEGRYVKLVTRNNENYLLEQSLENIDNSVDPDIFFRVNRQVLVSFSAIRQMIVWSKSRVKLDLIPTTDFDVIVSINNSGEFKRWLNK